MGQGPNWYQIRNKTCYMPKVSKFYEEKLSMLTDLKGTNIKDFVFICDYLQTSLSVSLVSLYGTSTQS